MQLHNQYAVNRNSILGSMLTLFVGMLSVIGAYGYVFLHTDVPECKQYDHSFTFVGLAWSAGAAIVVISIIALMCISLGYHQRREQFVIDSIRKRHYAEVEYNEIHPKNYNPYDKEMVNAMPTPYDMLFKVSCLVAILVLFSFCTKSLVFRAEANCAILSIVFVVFLISAAFVWHNLNKEYKRYSTCNDSYKTKNFYRRLINDCASRFYTTKVH